MYVDGKFVGFQRMECNIDSSIEFDTFFKRKVRLLVECNFDHYELGAVFLHMHVKRFIAGKRPQNKL